MDSSAKNSLTMEEILENLPSPVMIIKHHFLLWGNNSFWEFYLPDEAQNINVQLNAPKVDIYTMVKRDTRGALREYLLSLSSLERPFETILLSADKEYTPVLISGRCLNPSAPIEERIFLLVGTDISAKLKNEFLLYEMLEEIDEIFFVISVDNQKLQYINKRGLMLLRTNENDIKGIEYNKLFPDLQWPHLSNFIELATRNMMPITDKEINARISNERRVYLANIIPINDFNRTYSLMLITLREITKFQDNINLAKQLERIIQSIPDPMLIIDKSLNLRLINHAAMKLRGIDPMRIKSYILCADVFQLHRCQTDKCPMYRITQNKEEIKDEEVEIMDDMGKIRTFLLSIIPLHLTPDQTDYLMRFSDISAKKEYEKELTIYQQKLKEENVKLQEEITKMTITPVHETSVSQVSNSKKLVEPQLKIAELETGTSYIYTDMDTEVPFRTFIEQVHSGKLGLVISRIHPEKIREKYALKETPIVWVNSSVVDEEQKYIQPNLQVLLHLLKSFLKDTSGKNEKSVIFIDCLEYLTIYNEFKKIIQFYEVLSENIVLYQGISITSIDPNAFEAKELALLKRGSAVLEKLLE